MSESNSELMQQSETLYRRIPRGGPSIAVFFPMAPHGKTAVRGSQGHRDTGWRRSWTASEAGTWQTLHRGPGPGAAPGGPGRRRQGRASGGGQGQGGPVAGQMPWKWADFGRFWRGSAA